MRREEQTGPMRTAVLSLLAMSLIGSSSARARSAWDREVARLGKPCGPAAEVALVARLQALSREPGVRLSCVGQNAGLPLYRIDVAALRRPGAKERPLRVLVTAGVHGNERVGPAAAMALVQRVLRDPELRSRVELTVLPLLTHLGSPRSELNRSFGIGSADPAVRALEGSLPSGQFDLSLDLHSSVKADGFFLIGVGPACDGLARRSLVGLPGELLLGRSVGPYRLRTRGYAVTDTPGTLKGFLARHGVPAAFTVEAPARLDAGQQLRGMLVVLRSLLDNAAQSGEGRSEATMGPGGLAGRSLR
jgi:hypothetical protein